MSISIKICRQKNGSSVIGLEDECADDSVCVLVIIIGLNLPILEDVDSNVNITFVLH
jgi:hypothetical protein